MVKIRVVETRKGEERHWTEAESGQEGGKAFP